LTANTKSLLVSIRDDGIGGADPGLGSGLVGLTDRVEALGGSTDIRSSRGKGTAIVAGFQSSWARRKRQLELRLLGAREQKSPSREG
jgi:glucose-6-phosphate-specific signal transduction histidine kinase